MEGKQTRADIALKVRQLLGQATLLRARGRRAEALKLAQEVLTVDETIADAHEMVGDLLMELGRGGEALASFRRARELNPSRVVLEDKVARAALRRAAGMQAMAQAEAVLSGSRKLSAPVRKPGYAVLFSLLIPGLGQIYNEQLVKGVALLVGWLLLVTLTALGTRSWMSDVIARFAGHDRGVSPWSALGGTNAACILLLVGLYIYAVADAAICASKTMTSDSTGMV